MGIMVFTAAQWCVCVCLLYSMRGVRVARCGRPTALRPREMSSAGFVQKSSAQNFSGSALQIWALPRALPASGGGSAREQSPSQAEQCHVRQMVCPRQMVDGTFLVRVPLPPLETLPWREMERF